MSFMRIFGMIGAFLEGARKERALYKAFFANTGGTWWRLESRRFPHWNTEGSGGYKDMMQHIRVVSKTRNEYPPDLMYSVHKEEPRF